jgi:hypothetical protein
MSRNQLTIRSQQELSSERYITFIVHKAQLTGSLVISTHSSTVFEVLLSSTKKRISITLSWLISSEKVDSGSYLYLV